MVYDTNNAELSPLAIYSCLYLLDGLAEETLDCLSEHFNLQVWNAILSALVLLLLGECSNLEITRPQYVMLHCIHSIIAIIGLDMCCHPTSFSL